MHLPTSLKQRLAIRVGFAVTAVVASAFLLSAGYAGEGSKSVKPPEKTTESQGLSGADLYAMHCNRCHSERYPKEFQAAQWQTIMIHMRVRANLPASQAKEILKYLQQESGS